MSNSKLFEKYVIRGIEFRNRIWVAPMCQYSSRDGMPTDWHLVHLGSRAVGGAALVIMEATAVSPEGRISPSDAGIWSDAHAEAYQKITKFIKDQGAVAGIQIAHAGRKASTAEPWHGGKIVDEGYGGWETIAPSAEAFADDYPTPRRMTKDDIEKATLDFVAAAQRAVEAGFEAIEIHAAHGYLLHEFLSPLSNKRADEYGGSLENRMRFPLDVAQKVRAAVPEALPVFVRISATDWTDGGWDLEQSIEFCRHLKEIGIDLIDVSTGGNVMHAKIPVGPGYQVPFAAEIREKVGIATGAVGMITEPAQAEEILRGGQADAILIAREFLRDPYFSFTAAKALGEKIDYIPKQYGRAIEIREPESAHRVEKLKAGK
ncbi:MAG TPA: NADH:flavin oxidoreductase/NADH oxidase [Pyrinomonadaceae bacterium]|jgi:2,4-dienoyl-CoA reductase-like NADH-dependent reductase (Old Yellow Enzyme family)